LTDLAAFPYSHRGVCGTLLPYRSGLWTNEVTGRTWQGPLTYSAACPCGGPMLMVNDKPANRGGSWLPVDIEPPWTF
jgi:hypothetical protein